MKVLYLSSEAHPFSKVGGLSDVAGSLPLELNKAEVECLVCIPFSKNVQEKNIPYEVVIDDQEVEFNGEILHCNIYKSYFPETQDPIFFFDEEKYFRNYPVYADDNDLNVKRYIFFAKGVLKLLNYIDPSIDIIHFNDFFGSISPIYLKNPSIFGLPDDLINKKTFLSIHNIASQGKINYQNIENEFKNKGLLHLKDDVLNCLVEGIVGADMINTVSLTYRDELLTPEYSFGLDSYLKAREKDFIGILNAVNYDEFNPLTDNSIYYKYDSSSLDKKYKNKISFQDELSLDRGEDIPIISMVTRLVEQKGIDLIAKVIDEIMSLGVEFVILGEGAPEYEDFFKEVGDRYKGRTSVNIEFDEILEHKIYASSDIYLMPSKFEPGGLSNVIALKYGTVPIVRKTGGMADSIKDFDQKTRLGNGFVFSEYNASEMLKKINDCIDVYKQKELWSILIKNTMNSNFSWSSSAIKYKEAYECLLTANK